MLAYVYDGTFEGLLTAIYDAYYRRQHPDCILSQKQMQYNICYEYIYVATDNTKSNKVYNSIEQKISPDALCNVYNVFLSEADDAGTIIFEYLKLGWRLGKSVEMHLADERVHKVNKISLNVEHEKHKFTGFVRFTLTEEGVYYASIEPLNNIVVLLAPHFAERMSDVQWMIHDVKRGAAVVYNGKEWALADTGVQPAPDIADKDPRYQTLWKEFFNSIAVQGRINPKLQKSLMPIRYWRYLPEKR